MHSLWAQARRSTLRQLRSKRWLATLHGETLLNHIRQNGLSSPQVLEMIQRENNQTAHTYMKNNELFQRVYHEIQTAADRETPVREIGPSGQYYYFWTKSTHPIYSRVSAANPKEPEIVLDVPHIASMSLSADEEWIAYHTTASDNEIYLQNISNGSRQRIPTLPNELIVSVEIGTTPDTLFWVSAGRDGRPNKVYRCSIHDDNAPELVFHSLDPADFVHIQRCKGATCMAIHAQSQSSNEIHLLFTQTKNSTTTTSLQLARPREPGVVYHVDVGNQADVFLLVGDYGFYELRDCLVEQSLCSQLVRDEHVTTDMDIFQNFMVFYQRSKVDATQRIVFQDRRSEEWWRVDFKDILPEDDAMHGFVAQLEPAGNMHFSSSILQFYLQRPFAPQTTYRYNMETRTMVLDPDLSNEEAKTSEYIQRRVLVNSPDGSQVPLGLVYRRGGGFDVSSAVNRVVLMCYGAYGKALDLSFDPVLQPLLDRGFAIAYAHCRGGNEMGKSWHEQGRGRFKEKGVQDFLACAEYLHNSIGHFLQADQKSACKGKTRIEMTSRAFSAGGIIAGTAANQRPDLFNSVVLLNAFLDVKASLENPSLALTQHDWDEFGYPDNAGDRMVIERICPTSSIRPTSKLPAYLLVSTCDDRQVPFWNSLVFGSTVRLLASYPSVALYFQAEGGHHWDVERYSLGALQVAYILQNRTRKTTNGGR